MFREYPEHEFDGVSGDCPICGRYRSRSQISWRGKAFCCDKHRREYMWETISAEVMAEKQLWERLSDNG